MTSLADRGRPSDAFPGLTGRSAAPDVGVCVALGQRRPPAVGRLVEPRHPLTVDGSKRLVAPRADAEHGAPHRRMPDETRCDVTCAGRAGRGAVSIGLTSRSEGTILPIHARDVVNRAAMFEASPRRRRGPLVRDLDIIASNVDGGGRRTEYRGGRRARDAAAVLNAMRWSKTICVRSHVVRATPVRWSQRSGARNRNKLASERR